MWEIGVQWVLGAILYQGRAVLQGRLSTSTSMNEATAPHGDQQSPLGLSCSMHRVGPVADDPQATAPYSIGGSEDRNR